MKGCPYMVTASAGRGTAGLRATVRSLEWAGLKATAFIAV